LLPSIEWLKLVQSLAYQLFFLPDEASHIKAIEYVLNAYEHTEQIGEIVRFLYGLYYKWQNDQVNPSTRQMAKELLQYI